MEDLSTSYGWTPEEIERQDFSIIETYWKILQNKRYLENQKHKEMEKKMKSHKK